METKRRIDMKSNKGSITVFVLIAILFFSVVLISAYVHNMNTISSQQKNIKLIRENYEKPVKEIDQIYENTINESNINNNTTNNTINNTVNNVV